MRQPHRILLALLAAVPLASPAQADVASAAPAKAAAPAPTAPPSPPRRLEASVAWHAKQGKQLQRSWGVDVLGVRRTASGSMLRLDYKVLDPVKAAVLADRHAKPYLIDEKTRTALAVPAMENIGELRQVSTLEEGRTYYVIFGNPERLVKRGGRVTIVVGNLRAEGVVVE